jgi:hypothetical protein
MKIFVHRFQLTPKIELNRLSSTSIREGVFLKSETEKGVGYCEYFPHPELGDESIDEFLKNFIFQKTLAQKKALYFLDPKWMDLSFIRRFFNHQFHHPGGALRSKYLKYKIRHQDDFGFVDLLKEKKIVRLDANGLFVQKAWTDFFSKIPNEYKQQIDYIEDPIGDGDWNNFSIPCAQDFIQGSPYEVKIYKPYREFFPVNEKRIIFSGNMGHGLSNYQSYLELVQFGDLKETHGLLTDSIYEETPQLFTGNYDEGFLPNLSEINNYLKEISSLSWTQL